MKEKKGILIKVAAFLTGLATRFVKSIRAVPNKVKRYIFASVMFLFCLICFLSFFNLAGKGGEEINLFFFDLFGHILFIVPVVSFTLGVIFLCAPRKFLWLAFLAGLFFLGGGAGILYVLRLPFVSGGEVGNWEGKRLIALFGELVSFFAFFGVMGLSGFTLWHIIETSLFKGEEEKQGFKQKMKGFLAPDQFKVFSLEPERKKIVSQEKDEPEKEKDEGVSVKKRAGRMELPPLTLLRESKKAPRSRDTKKEAAVIQQTLANFGIEVKMVGESIGPTVTQYALKPPHGVRLSKITGLSNNLALALAAHPIRIEAPIPGKSLIGVEVPNEKRDIIGLRELFSHPIFADPNSGLTFPLGQDVAGKPIFCDLAGFPHLLVAGATGTGKTVFLNSLILSLLYKKTPEDLRLILIDPKRVEFYSYEHLPHLMCPVISDPDQTLKVLTWLVEEMQKRFRQLSKEGSRNIFSYNKKVGDDNKLPSLVLIVDELADLMMARGKELEGKIVRIAQMARAVGIYLVIATQRPSVEVITGLIKANIANRVSFQLPTQIDSRTVIDMAGAEKLLGAGDMLFISPRNMKPQRIQGPYVSEKEVKDVTTWIEKNMTDFLPGETESERELQEFLEQAGTSTEMIDGMAKDPLLEEAKRIVVRSERGSASLLQRRLRVGYVRAARLLDMLEVEGVVGPARSGKIRKVLLSQGELDGGGRAASQGQWEETEEEREEDFTL